MAGDTYQTIYGNLAGDPELKFTPSGAAVANFTIASTPRTFDRNTNEWKDGETLWMRCSIWRQAAENVAESLAKGMAVVAYGRLVSRPWETKEGEKRTSIELQVEHIGPDLLRATATVVKNPPGQGGGGGYGGNQDPGGYGGGGNQAQAQGYGGGSYGGGGGQSYTQATRAQQANDPWANPPGGGGGWSGGQQPDEPPF